MSSRRPREGSIDRIQFFASSAADPRARRSIDVVQFALHLAVLVVAALMSTIGSGLDRGIRDAAASFPPFLTVLWLSGFWLAAGWAPALLVMSAARRRFALAGQILVAAALAVAVAVLVAAVVTDTPGDVIRHLADSNGPPVFPPASLAITSAVIATIAPYVTLPFRRFGRALILMQVLGSLFLGVSETWGVIAALAIGLMTGSLVHVAFGSPGGLPTVSRVRDALRDLGVEATSLAPTSVGREGVLLLAGEDDVGTLEVKVYGRDAWEGELLADLWRLMWYRGSQRTARLSRGEYVEHEGFMTTLASSASVRVPAVVTAGVADNGDALIAVRPDGTPLGTTFRTLTANQIASLWGDLGRFHSRGITHHRIDLDRVVIRSDGSVGFSDLSSASVRSDAVDKIADNAQLIAFTAVTADPDIAIEQAQAALGEEALRAAIPYLQSAAVPPMVRAELHKRHVDLDAMRKTLVTRLHAPDDELVKIRRVTWRSLLNVALLAVAAYTIIGLIAGIDFDAFGRALKGANWWWLVAALLIGQTPRIANAVSTMGSSIADVPLGPTTALHFATCYVNLAVPSSAGRVAITTRFFQRFGVPPATAVSAGVIDSLSEFLVQITLFVLVFFISDVDLGLTFNTHQLSGLATTALIIVVVLLIAGVIAFLVPSIRQRVKVALRQARDALNVLRMPRKLVELFGGNLMSQVLFAVTLGAAARGFGYDVPLSTLILINTVVGLFAGLLPVPGGIGVSEAGLSLGLTRAGIPSDTALPVAISYRFCVFYLPPFWGYASYRWMVSRRYL